MRLTNSSSLYTALHCSTRSVYRQAVFLCLPVFMSLPANGQLKTEIVQMAALPKGINYQGKPVQAIRYQDKSGTFVALTTQTGIQTQKGGGDNQEAHLYAYLYQLIDAVHTATVWQLNDQVTDCPLDIVAGFIPNSLVATDLDNNGKAEVWIAYRLSCRGDISPSDLKIIMHEGTTKYAMRGTGKLKVGNALQPDGGEISSNDFKKGPAAFKQYADRLWGKYVLEVIK